MRNKGFLDELVAIMRYAYCPNEKGSFPEVSVERWHGKSGVEPEPGVDQYVVGMLWDKEKAAYKAGYIAGSNAVFGEFVKDLPNDRVVEWNESDASIGAERSFNEWAKK